MALKYARFSLYWVNLDPTIGSEISKKRPCVIVSPNEMNAHLNTVIIAPLTSTHKPWPTRVAAHVQGKDGQVALDQIRTISTQRLMQPMGMLDEATQRQCLDVLADMFAA